MGIRKSITKRGLSGPKRKTLNAVASYLYRNRTRMRYHAYLANGWPIASGPVEGACQNLIKDRMERSGMRWSEQWLKLSSNSEPSICQGILIATGNSTSNRINAAYTPPGRRSKNSHTQIIVYSVVKRDL